MSLIFATNLYVAEVELPKVGVLDLLKWLKKQVTKAQFHRNIQMLLKSVKILMTC